MFLKTFNFNSKETFWFLGLLLIITAWRIGLVLQPLEKLVEYTVADDMFYYLKMAEHWLAGKGISFDGQAPTNGFHPLYFLLCAGVIFLKLSREQSSLILLSFSVVLGIVTTLLVARIVKKLTGDNRLSLLALILFGMNPYVVSQQLNGLETSLYGLMLAGTFLSYLQLRLENLRTTWPWIGFGALLGLTFLSRTESIFLLVAFLFELIWRHGKQPPDRRQWVLYSAAGMTTALVVLPWVVWNFREFGTMVQDSGAAIAYYAQQKYIANLGHQPTLFNYVHSAFLNLNDNLFILASMLLGIPITVAQKYAFFFMLLPWLIIIYFSLRYQWFANRSELLAGTGPGLVFLVMIFAYYTFYHRVAHWRYFYAWLVILIPIGIAGINPKSLADTGKGYLTWGLVGLGGLFLFAANWLLIVKWENYPWQGDMFKTTRWLQQHIPPEAKIGAFNGGIYGYWSDHTVVNLDGVVNHPLLAVLKNRTLGEYLEKNRIEYLCDYESAIADYLHFFSRTSTANRLKLIYSIRREEGKTRAKENLVVYQILPKKE